MKKTILIITCQGLPESNLPATGGSLRMHGLGEGLKSRGHYVIYSIPETCIDASNPLHTEWMEHSHTVSNINDRIAQIKPDIIIFGNWGLLFQAEACDIPVIVDINGSLILENHYRNRGWPILDDALNKIKSFSKVDLIIAGSHRQKMYITAWCLMAGMDPDKISIEVVPFSLSPELPDPIPPEEPHFVMAGYNWPWLEGQEAIETVSHELTCLQRGHLHIYTMPPPFVDTIPGEDSSNDFAGRMDVDGLPRITLHDPVGFDELTSILSRSSVALDLWGRNLERELAFPTRTIVYLWSGLPVIVSAYSEVSDLIRRYNAGWAIDPSNHSRLCELVRDIVCGRVDFPNYRTNAQLLVSDHFVWDKTIESIDGFCRHPVKNRISPPLFTNHLDLQKRFEESQKSNNSLKNTLRESEKISADLQKELVRFQGINLNLRKEVENLAHLNDHLNTENWLMGMVHRRPKGFAMLTSATLLWLTSKRFFIGLPVLFYLFSLAGLGQFLLGLSTRWKRS